MDQVPKVLKPMVQQWAPEGFVVSFKLETDINLLIPKAEAALERYGHQIVIANDLQTRKDKVCFVTSSSVGRSNANGSGASSGNGNGVYGSKWLELGQTTSQNASGGPREIEEDIVRELETRHEQWIADGKL